MEENRIEILKRAEEQLDTALGSLENAFYNLASIGFISNDDNDLKNASGSYNRIDFSAIASLRNYVLEELGEI